MTRQGSRQLAQALQEMVAAGLPGAFIYIEDAEGSSTFLTAGVADVGTGKRMAPDSHYRIGSTTKMFTAIVILQLVAEGRLRLTDLVGQLLPGRDMPNRDELRVEHLLRMRSGLADFVDHPSLLELDANLAPHALEDILSLALTAGPSFEPGERFAYCNTNFCLLEWIVQQVTGRTLGQEISERILKVLDMRNTWYPPEDDLSLPEPYIRGYDHTRTGWRECSQVFFGRGDGAIISTALDLSRFFRGLFAGRLVSQDLLAQMQFVVEDDVPPAYAYGMGLIADTLADRIVWGHSGRGWGYHHLPFMDPETGRLVICMQNGTYGFRVSTIPADQQPRFTPHIRQLAYGKSD